MKPLSNRCHENTLSSSHARITQGRTYSHIQRLVTRYIEHLIPRAKRVSILSQERVARPESEMADYLIVEAEVTTNRELVTLLNLATSRIKERACLVFWRRIAKQQPPTTISSSSEIEHRLRSAGWTMPTERHLVVWPFSSGPISQQLNRWIGPLLPFACQASLIVARQMPSAREHSCSIIVPARNEAGNIAELLDRLPPFGKSQEIIVIEGGSTDATWKTADAQARGRPNQNITVLKQRSHGKGPAVREALKASQGELAFILDADLTVDPEVLPAFYQTMLKQDVDFINGNRFSYPMAVGAMRGFNWIGNKVFAILMSALLGTRFSDTLCGTKVFYREDFVNQNDKLTDLDPFGDFSLLIGAGRQHLRIHQIAVRYRARKYGHTNIRRWRDGWLLFRLIIRDLRITTFLPYRESHPDNKPS